MNKRKKKAEKLLREELTSGDQEKTKRTEMETLTRKKKSIFLCEVETVVKMKASTLGFFIHHTPVHEKFMDGLN